jgi:LmbE family N-acetylglucosaminyl deacetylase
MKNKILVIAAHPDDEILGCGGTIRRLVDEGCEAYVLILGEGVTSRDEKRDLKKRKAKISNLKEEMLQANRLIGATSVTAEDLPDNRFDSVPFLDITKIIEKHKARMKPDIVFTHYQFDLNIDHRITYEAVMTASRPLARETVKEIYSFEILSSTEWSSSACFSPDTFFDISGTIKNKLDAMKKYRSELCKYPHPRSLEGVELSAKYWGMRIGLEHAEAFKNIRRVR